MTTPRCRAVTTGGARGVGLATGERLLANDSAVSLRDLDGGALAAAEKALFPTGGSMLDLPLGDWHRALAVNLTGALLCVRAFVPKMRSNGWGRVFNVASIAGKEARPHTAQYGASKAALISLTKSLGSELAASDVR
ncbi:MAG: SDR family oxidoreductase [Mycobacterium sp.]